MSMFDDVQVGDRVRLAEFATRSMIDAEVVDVSEYGVWAELAGGITIYDDECNRWVRVGGVS